MANDGSEPAGETWLRGFRIVGRAYRFVVSSPYVNGASKLTAPPREIPVDAAAR